MGHHHKKNRTPITDNLPQAVESNAPSNMDLSSMLGNLNLGNVDLSKVDMNKVQSMMNKISPQTTRANNTPNNNRNLMDSRIELLNSLKSILPSKRAKTMDSITKFIQITQLMNTR